MLWPFPKEVEYVQGKQKHLANSFMWTTLTKYHADLCKQVLLLISATDYTDSYIWAELSSSSGTDMKTTSINGHLPTETAVLSPFQEWITLGCPLFSRGEIFMAGMRHTGYGDCFSSPEESGGFSLQACQARMLLTSWVIIFLFVCCWKLPFKVCRAKVGERKGRRCYKNRCTLQNDSVELDI